MTYPTLVTLALSGFGRGALRFALGLAVAVLVAFVVVAASLVAVVQVALPVALEQARHTPAGGQTDGSIPTGVTGPAVQGWPGEPGGDEVGGLAPAVQAAETPTDAPAEPPGGAAGDG